MNTLVLGIDIGTQGARAVVTDMYGKNYASQSVPFAVLNIAKEAHLKEQDPQVWWTAAVQAIKLCIAELEKNGRQAQDIRALCVDATSGTVLALDENNDAISVGIMYNDPRAQKQAEEISGYAGELERVLGYRVNSSFGLPKIVWLMGNSKKRARRFVHQQDFIIGRLSGEYGVTDYSNALKTCYDLTQKKWPTFFEKLGLDEELLPKVVAPGTVIGKVQKCAARETGLSENTLMVAGATDGYASALAAGISDCGDWASIIGTTMVLKGIERSLITDEHGRIYSHLHPQGYWLLGGASNIGGRCLNENFDKSRFDEYNGYAQELTPTGAACYPLTDKGERFPFVSAEAEGFLLCDKTDEKTKYTALLEGVGYAERLSFEMLEALGCEVKDEIFTAGGACKSEVWLQIRSDILNKALKVPVQTDAVMGTALIASLATGYKTLKEASENMIKISKTVYPSKRAGSYDEGYFKTKAELERRGYLV
ncbi:MAG: FGGY family carbohydrate kinase [Christensenella sp.]